MKHPIRGSILLEIAIAVSIMGIISGYFITKQISINRMMRVQKTKSNIEATTAAIASFVACNSRIPRPALIDSEDGIEAEDIKVASGKIPYNTLGIPEKNTVDGDCVPLSYIVEPELTVCQSIYAEGELESRESYFCKHISTEQRLITIRNQSEKNDVVVFVLDTKNNAQHHIISGDKIEINPSTNTFWLRRSVLLIQYLKMSPWKEKSIVERANVRQLDSFG